jgi:hypothetical protein
MTKKHDKKITNREVINLMLHYLDRSKIIAFRIVLIGLFITALVPYLRTVIFGNLSIALPILVALGFIAFEMLLAASKHAETTSNIGLVVENTQELVSYLEKAFVSKHVLLDICAYSSETFHVVLAPFFRRIIDRDLILKKLHIRLLVRDYRRPFVVPCDGNLKEDPIYRSATVSRNQKFIDDFFADINQIKDACPDTDIEFEIRLHPFEPLFKGVIMSGNQAFWNLYPIMNARRQIGSEEKIIWDYYGERTRLIQLKIEGPIAERELLTSFQNWFATVWDYFSSPVGEVHHDEV